MRTNLRGAAVNLFGTENKVLGDEIKNACTERYDLNNFVFQKGIGVGFDIAEINQDKLDLLVSKPWANDGKNFSSRLWTQKEQMVSNLYNQLVRVCVGGSMKEAVETMMRYLDIEVENKMATARRLINTEMAYFTSEAQKMSYKELGCEQYEIVATLDGKTSHICQDMDGKVFDLKDFTAGITAPPFHPNCRSTTCPYFNDEFTEGETRAAKSETGITYKVSSDMTYAEWKRMVENNKRELYNSLIGLRISTGIIKTINKHFIDRAIERKVSVEDIKDALINPLVIGDAELNSNGKPSVEFNGRKAVVQLNPNTNTLITTWKMSKSKLKKILQR